ncbi:MAG: copper-translocating P-type ATPase [Acidimicrobiia bacterium]|nr:copper-translocating P-type ATPase [Acidimicrobiia bacterium]
MDEHSHRDHGPDTKDHAGHEDHVGHEDHEHGHVDHAGHGDHAGHEDHEHGHHGHGGHGDHTAQFRDRFWLTLILSLPVIFYSEMIQGWFNYTAPAFPGSEWIAPVLGTVIFFYGGAPFLTGARSEIRARQPGMMLLVSLGITVSFVASLANALGFFQMEYWWELALLIVIMLLGHWLEMRALGQASGALDALAQLLPDEAVRVDGDNIETVPLGELEVGDLVLVRPGARVPADGSIESGAAEFDESNITGESRPVAHDVGDEVVAGTVATDNAVQVRVSAVGEDTALAGIQRLVAEAESSRSRAQDLADRAAALLFYVAVVAAAITAFVWLTIGTADDAIGRTVSVLVISCPHALGLAIPLVTAISTAMSSRRGILVKNRMALERTRQVDLVLFDKTGTLTLGEHRVQEVFAVDGDTDRMVAMAAAAERNSEHPVGRAIIAEAQRRGDIPTSSGFRAMSGRGVEAEVDSRTVAVGGPALLAERGVGASVAIKEATEPWMSRGASVLWVVVDGEAVGAISLEDQVRPESVEAVRELHSLGVKVGMITGDAQQVADAVARDLGIDEVMAEVLPEDKHDVVARLVDEGMTVAMVGDGVNDAPALARADIGIAIGAGTDVAIESADMVLVSDDPRGVVTIRELSDATYSKMVQNLVWAAGYNIVAIPLAAGALAWSGFVLPPAGAAVLMSLSTIVVALNAQLLRGALD